MKKYETHGQCKSQLYKKWVSMKQRTNNPNTDNYERYGGRGICVCKEWESYINFFTWAMDNGYQIGLSLERIDVNGNYEPSNCKWIPLENQCENRRDTILLTYNNKTQSLTKWARELSIPRTTLYKRIKMFGWDVERALTT